MKNTTKQAQPKGDYQKPEVISGVPESGVALALSELLKKHANIIHVAENDKRANELAASLPFFAPDVEVLLFPSWDVLPYDRASPNPVIVTERLQTLVTLSKTPSMPRLIIATASSWLQRVPPKSALASHVWEIVKGNDLDREIFSHWLLEHGYRNMGKAVESGEFAFRGSIIDIIPSGQEQGYRIDLFGDTVEHIRQFDPLSQKSEQEIESLNLLPASEVLLTPEHIDIFRSQYRDAFGAVSKTDPMYEAVCIGSRYTGMEHWLPMFYNEMQHISDYVNGAYITFDEAAIHAIDERQLSIEEYYQARKSSENQKYSDIPYHPLPPEKLYVLADEQSMLVSRLGAKKFSGFAGQSSGASAFHMRRGFALAEQALNIPPLKRVAQIHKEWAAKNKKLLVVCYSIGSRERLAEMLRQQDLQVERVEYWRDMGALPANQIGIAVLPMPNGLETPEALILSEPDILGERLVRTTKKKRSAEYFMQEAASFNEGELVVHREHGIGRFEKLETLDIAGARHDCLKVTYDGGDRLFVPVENIDVLSRYGSEEENVALDKLGSAQWQMRKAKLKERISIAAAELMKVAAERLLKPGVVLQTNADAYDDFTARFPYSETEDQERSIEEVVQDLQSGKPMDRLVCGDVGFGKTEVALRAAFVAVKSEPKQQVAVVVPTTLLARQHFQNFSARFAGLGVNVRQISRMVSAKEAKLVKSGLKDGSVDIVIGTHALLAKDIEFKNLGLVIVDEEQHFGVAQKEKLKALKSDVHVLTLSATPIPRTLQLSLSGVRDLSLITTPPVDRLAVRSFVMPFDPVVLREALVREKNRGGGSFIVTPRIQDIGDLKAKILELIPDFRVATAHGQMSATELDDIMNRFYERQIDVLISTAIIESGLDIPHANTIIIHKADRFGLSQLYQMRGRVGRSKTRAYAYFLLPHGKVLTRQATRRLEVMQTLDRLGAGFTLASHDMDIRGFGNLVGEEQSGHIREVGIELYQHMLAEAVESARAQSKQLAHARKAAGMEEDPLPTIEEEFSPQINLGMSVLIPEEYVEDLSLRMGLYRRIADTKTTEELDALAVEMVDRFGPLPAEVQALFDTMQLKQLCRTLCIEKLDAGPKGLVVLFRPLSEAYAAKLMQFIQAHPTSVKLRPDQSLFVSGQQYGGKNKIGEIRAFLKNLHQHFKN